MTEEEKQAYIERVVAKAPPLTTAQRSKLSALFAERGPEEPPSVADDSGFSALREVAESE